MRRWTLVLLSAATVLSACAGPGAVRRPEGKDRALIFGRIQHPGAKIERVVFYEQGKIYAPPFKFPPHAHVLPDGTFFLENCNPGVYVLAFFSANGMNYHLLSGDPAANLRQTFEVKPGSLRYVGAFKVTGETSNLIMPDEFSFERDEAVPEREVLGQVLEATKGTGWDDRIRSKPK